MAASEPKYTVDEFESRTVTSDQVVRSLIRNGGVFVRNLVPLDAVAQIEADARPFIASDHEWAGDFFPIETKRVCGLAGKSPTFVNHLINNPLFTKVCEQLLSSEVKQWTGNKLNTSVSKPQVNATVVFSIAPGAKNQDLHRDDSIHHNYRQEITADQYLPGRDTSVGLFVAGKKTTRQNGATRFIPGSHLQDSLHPPDEEKTVYAELNPGDAFIMLSSCYHGGSANTTKDEERLLYSAFMTKGYLRQEENVYLSVPLEKIREYPPEIRNLLGYGVSAPFLGWVDLQDPRKVIFGEDVTDDMF